MATLHPTHTHSNAQKNLTLVVTAPKRLGALPVVIIINRLALKELSALLFLFLRDVDLRKGTLFPFCVPIHKKKGNKYPPF